MPGTLPGISLRVLLTDGTRLPCKVAQKQHMDASLQVLPIFLLRIGVPFPYVTPPGRRTGADVNGSAI
jgi:hypothetical protein